MGKSVGNAEKNVTGICIRGKVKSVERVTQEVHHGDKRGQKRRLPDGLDKQ